MKRRTKVRAVGAATSLLIASTAVVGGAARASATTAMCNYSSSINQYVSAGGEGGGAIDLAGHNYLGGSFINTGSEVTIVADVTTDFYVSPYAYVNWINTQPSTVHYVGWMNVFYNC